MTTLFRNLWQAVTGQKPTPSPAPQPPAPVRTGPVLANLDFAPNDPLVAYFQATPGVVDLTQLRLASAALEKLKADGHKLVVPLINQGELVGLINVGVRRSEQDYSSDDHGLLNTLATQSAPAVRVAQLVRQQKLEALARERYEQELRVARLIQQTLLPQALPQLPGWQVWAYYQPARAVGGDFYDFLNLPDGRLAAVIGDVTDKGVPAALVMATVRSLLRAALEQFAAPGRVLEYTNEHLCGDIPPKMFVTCLVALINTTTGEVQYANAGHDLPYRRHAGGVQELRATGMPLGLLPGMVYEERTVTLTPGDSLLLYSDGLVEAHNPQREMFGFPRLQASLGQHAGGEGLIEFLVESRAQFVGPEWEQEDDTAIVILQSVPSQGEEGVTQTLAEFSVPSEPGNERQVMKQVAEAASPLLPAARLEKLKTAVAEATMNAIEHGNKNHAELPVSVHVLRHGAELIVRIRDMGRGNGGAAATPNLDAKLEGLQSPRGWGLFLIEKMVDRLTVTETPTGHVLELALNLEGDTHA